MGKKGRREKAGNGFTCPLLYRRDAEALPYRDHQFDLVVSNLTYQWLDDLSTAFKEAQRILGSQGYFVLSLLGKNIFFELKDSYRSAQMRVGNLLSPHFHEFAEREALHEILTQEGFVNVHITAGVKQEYHPDIRSIFFTLKAIGAKNVSKEAPKGLGRRDLFNSLASWYEENYKTSSGLSLTHEIYYVVAFKD